MTSVNPPTYYFNGIQYNSAFFNSSSDCITLSQADSKYLGRQGNPISIATSTTFTGSLSASTITATTFTGALNGNANTATQIAITPNGNNAVHYLTFSDTNTAGNINLHTNSGILVNPSTDTITATTFSGSLNGTATNATNVNLSATATGNPYYLVMSGTQSGSSALLTDNSGASYDSTTNTAVINITGNSATTTTSTNTTNILTTSDNTSGTYYPTFVKTSGTANKPIFIDDTTGPLTYNPSTAVLSTGTLNVTGNIGLSSSILTYTSSQIGYTTTTILNTNINLGTGVYQELTITIPSAGVYMLSGTMMLTPSVAVTSSFRGCGFSDLNTQFRNPQSAYSSTSMSCDTSTITLPVTANPIQYYQHSSTTWVAASTFDIYFLGLVNFSAGTLKSILQVTLTRIG